MKKQLLKIYSESTSFSSILLDNELIINDEHNNFTILHKVIKNKNFDFLKIIVQKCAELKILNNKNTQGYTALMLAFLKDNSVLAQLLLDNGADIKIDCNGHYTVLHFAYGMKDEKILDRIVYQGAKEQILDKQNAYGQSALHLATAQKNFKLVKLLLEYKADVKVSDFSNSTILHYIHNVHDLEIVKMLVDVCEKEGVINQKKKNWPNKSVLEISLECSQYSVAQYLLEKKATFQCNFYINSKQKILVDSVLIPNKFSDLLKQYPQQNISNDSSILGELNYEDHN